MYQVKKIHQTNANALHGIDGNTKVFGLLGEHLSYSLSFQLHNTAFRFFNKNAIYTPFVLPIEHSKSFFDGLLKGCTNIGGFNITTPYKSDFLEHPLISSSESVKKTGSMNTLIKKDNLWIAENSDIMGFVHSISHIDLQGRDILILGAGGVVPSILYALSQKILNTEADQNIYLYNRTFEKAQALSKTYDIHVLKNMNQWHHPKNAVIINCTSMGQGKQKSLMSFMDPRPFYRTQIIIDLIYSQTPLLQKAQHDNAVFCDGLSMLIWQAAISFSWWTGIATEVCYDHMNKIIKKPSSTLEQ